MRTLIITLMLLFSPLTAYAGSFAYISVSGEKRIAVFRVDDQTGELTRDHDVSLKGSPGSLAVDPKKQFLFASLRSTRELSSFRINPKNGKLTHLSTVSPGTNAAYVSTDRSGKFLLAAYYTAGLVTVHRIGRDGKLNPKPVQSIKTDVKAHAILAHPSNRLVFVPHTGPNAIYQFHFDPKTGRLTPNAMPKVKTGENTGPRHLAFHPNGSVVYFDNEQGSSVTAFRLDSKTGRLKAFQTLPTLPKDFSKRNSCSDIEITPDGRFLYVANRGHNSLAGYAVDAKTGRLKALGQTATEAIPRSFNIDPSGRFLYAAGQSSGKLAAYRIDRKTGALKRFATYEVGKGPSWVQVVNFP